MNEKLSIIIYEAVSTMEFQENETHYLQRYKDDDRQCGIYFFIYSESAIPYYIGSSQNMFKRLSEHIALYKGKGYYTPKQPHKLASLSCFLKDSTPETFYAGKFNNFDDEFDTTVDIIMQNTQVLLSYIRPENAGLSKDMRNLVYDAEIRLYTNLAERMGLKLGWIGDGGISKDKSKSLGIYNSITLSLEYEIETSIQQLNKKLLL